MAIIAPIHIVLIFSWHVSRHGGLGLRLELATLAATHRGVSRHVSARLDKCDEKVKNNIHPSFMLKRIFSMSTFLLCL